jgi:hypothetical protein
MARLKKDKKKVNLSIKGHKAEIDDDLYESKDGTLRQKFDDDGHMSEEWRRILMGEQLRVQRKTRKKKG